MHEERFESLKKRLKINSTYDDENRVTALNYGTGSMAYTYDQLGRITQRTVKPASTNIPTVYTYVPGGHGANSATGLVQTITQNGVTLTYAYDDRGNITSVSDGTKTTSYEYDAIGQLIRVNDQTETTAGSTGTTWVFTYDLGGNIQTKNAYPYTTGTVGTATETHTYTYGNSAWRDQLTAFDGVTISYDAIGNPTSDGTWSYTWQHGHQLAQMGRTGETVSFEYNEDGLRTKKTVTVGNVSTITEYVMHGKNVVHMTRGSDSLHFFYDASNRPAIVEWNNGSVTAKYAYIHNLQGDIVGIVDSNGTEVVKYTYDAWGKVLSTTGSLASTLGTIQPFRYRGYVYDVETECYYLRSRYYNPGWTLFLNADEISFCILQDNLLSYSPNKYCRNNPINASDENGEFWGAILVGAFVGAICSIVTQVINGERIKPEKVLVSAAAGALTAIPGIGFGATILITGSAQVANDAIDGKVNDIKDGVISFVQGAASGAVGYGVGKIISYTTPRNSFYANASNSARKKMLSQLTSLTGQERIQLKTAEGFASLVDSKGLGGALFGEKIYAGTCEFSTDLTNVILGEEIERWR